MFLDRTIALSRKGIALYGAIFSLLLTGCAFINSLGISEHGVSIPAVCYLVFSFGLGLLAHAFGLRVFIFLLPLAPALTQQFAAVLQAHALPRAFNGSDLVVGFVLGGLMNFVVTQRGKLSVVFPPWPVGLACLVLTASAGVAIARNLWQSASVFSIEGLWFNLVHAGINGPHDDYYPLNDLLVFGLCAALIGIVIPLLRQSSNSNRDVFQPLMLGVIVAGGWSIFQARTGIGLPWSSATGYRYYQATGYAATGFQPDIHAFAGHMLIGAVGLWGCLLGKSFPLRRTLFVLALAFGWLGLMASKSRGSALLAVIATLAMVGYLVWRRNRTAFFACLSLTLACVGGIYWFHRIGLSIIPLGLIQYVESLPRIHVNNLLALNEHFGYRAEIYHAGLRMLEAFPVFGLGQGDFYRMSANGLFARSRFLASIHGENAHNYFLQTLTELGLAGSLALILVFAVPIVACARRAALAPALFAIASLCLGNIFAHSLLIRENLYLLCVLIALLYASSLSEQKASPGLAADGRPGLSRGARFGLLGFVVVLLAMAASEVARSFGRFPYQYGVTCFNPAPAVPNEWSTGQIVVDVPPGARQLALNLNDTQPDVARRPLSMDITLIGSNKEVLGIERRNLTTNGPQAVLVPLPPQAQTQPINVVITLSRCFVPRNVGYNADGRRLGLLVRDAEFSY